ncbi:MAG: hypothetical protein HY540_05785 [Deltaproteobacteria bacterium]|nr:hypothetical protein [Deltaproteobacteria bacterium]
MAQSKWFRKVTSSIIFSLLIFTTISVKANECAMQTSRKGFYLAGAGLVGSEAIQNKKFSIGAGLRIGGGITEKVLLYVEGIGSVVDQGTLQNLLTFDGQLKTQIFLWEGLYTNFGAGVAVGRVQTATILLSSAKAGFGVSGGAGYEFRVGRKFFVAPEFQVRYQRLAGTSYLTPGIGGQIGWHF